MNLRTLRYFVAIADAGSFTAAAAAVAIAQPALTRQLRDLEADLGVQLFQRGARGVRLTPAGATLYESARRMLAEAERVRRQLGGAAEDADSTVTLGLSPTLTRVLLPGVFERCHQQLAGVRLVVREAFTPQLLDGLERGGLDMAILTNPEPQRGLALQPLLVEPFALVTPAARGLPAVVPLAQLARVPLLMTRLHRSIVERGLAPLGAQLSVEAEIDSVDAIRELVLQGRRCTVMPVSVFKDAPPATVRLSEISGAQLHRMLVLARKAEARPRAALGVVGELVQAEAQRLAAEGVFSFGRVRAPEPPAA
ncbi:LysR family transcriptional regulator [Xylophilus rhododendri]|uniref:LysR family transcriptional regulator n=1 Tax=Xylophilus rhododendri TaxID=2697032 RepID=A0A857J308_9BURK|nr:LysR family transcriptional regulator [Xylophilus rhododendri]QHI98320.1 LysR family transcriptional regulator [Xylophilus rhododendri]